jgi:uncharacterized protein
MALTSDPLLPYVLVLLATGVIVGFACGLLGVGGGFIMVPVQIWVLTSNGIDPDLAVRIAFGTSLAVILPTSISGCHGHSCKGVVLWRPGLALGISGLFGSLIGGTIASYAPVELLTTFFGLVVLTGALRMLFSRDLSPKGKPKKDLLHYILWGLLVGIVAGMTGIGGGVILVPVMVIALGFSMHQAAGTSSLAIAFIAAGGVLAYIINGWGVSGLPPYSLGYIDLPQFVLLAGSSIITAHLGANVAHRMPGEQLRYIFIALMFYIGLKMMGLLNWLQF